MIGLKKIITTSFILFLLCLSVYSKCAGVDVSATAIGTKFQVANVGKQHADLPADFVMELIDDDLSEKTSAHFSEIHYYNNFSNLGNNFFRDSHPLFRSFYSIKIKPVASEPSFLMNFRI